MFGRDVRRIWVRHGLVDDLLLTAERTSGVRRASSVNACSFRLRRFDQKRERRAHQEQRTRSDKAGIKAAALRFEHLLQAAQDKPTHAPGREEQAVVNAEVLQPPEILRE